jgi:hypothetical protein
MLELESTARLTIAFHQTGLSHGLSLEQCGHAAPLFVIQMIQLEGFGAPFIGEQCESLPELKNCARLPYYEILL